MKNGGTGTDHAMLANGHAVDDACADREHAVLANPDLSTGRGIGGERRIMSEPRVMIERGAGVHHAMVSDDGIAADYGAGHDNGTFADSGSSRDRSLRVNGPNEAKVRHDLSYALRDAIAGPIVSNGDDSSRNLLPMRG